MAYPLAPTPVCQPCPLAEPCAAVCPARGLSPEQVFARLVEEALRPSDRGRRCHGEAFCAWLSLSLREQYCAVDQYLRAGPLGVHAENLRRALAADEARFRLVPPGALDAEQAFALADLEVVLRLLGGGRSADAGCRETAARARAILELLENPGLPRLTLEDFADRCAISAGWLRKWLKRRVGDSFPALVKRARLRAAARLLRATSARVDEAAAGAGYAHAADFCRDFKRLLGVSPESYRFHWRRRLCRPPPPEISTESAGFDN